MNYEITYHPAFNRDLKRIRIWIQEFADYAVGKRQLREIRVAIRRLADFPNRGSTDDDIVPGLRLVPVGEQVVVTFVVDDQSQNVHVPAVSYAGSDRFRTSRDRSN